MINYRPISQAAVDLVRINEALILRVYDDAHPERILVKDSKVEGVLTAGYGHTSASLRIGDLVTPTLAEAWLMQDLQKARIKLYGVVAGAVIDALTVNQYAALLDFVFNLGTGNGAWTIWKRLNAKQFDQVPLEMIKFVNVKRNGQTTKLEGLVRRRAAECSLWAQGEPGSLDSNPPSSVTRAVETPATPADVTPPGQSKTMIASAVSAVAAVPAAASQVISAMQPYSDKSDFVSHLVTALAVIAAVAAGLTAMWYYWKKHDLRN